MPPTIPTRKGAMRLLQPETFESVRALLAAKTIGCTGHPNAPKLECGPCSESDPLLSYAPLLALFEGVCSPEKPHYHSGACPQVINRLDYWQAAPNGALEGALLKAGDKTSSLDLRVALINMVGRHDPAVVAEDTRQQALEAVLDWLEGDA